MTFNLLLSSAPAAAGISGDSSSLIANALDNLSDGAVYAIGYFAVERSQRRRTKAVSVMTGNTQHSCEVLGRIRWTETLVATVLAAPSETFHASS